MLWESREQRGPQMQDIKIKIKVEQYLKTLGDEMFVNKNDVEPIEQKKKKIVEKVETPLL